MKLPFLIAGALSLLAAAIHGGAGEALVVRKLSAEALFSTRLGGPAFTKLMIRATWHITTLAFVVIGGAMVACAPADSSQACGGVGRLASLSFASFAALTLGLVARQGPLGMLRALRRHPAPLAFVLVAVLAWWGSAS